MSQPLVKIGIVTPLRNEINNITELFKSIQGQSIPIYYWVIIENDSSDGSVELLNQLKSEVKNVENLLIINQKNAKSNYELGVKYASVVKTGFDIFQEKGVLERLDYVGILDADCFPEKDYYQKLTDFMIKTPKLGISSGIIYDENGKADLANKNWVRGGCRLWAIDCFKEAPYVIAPSADTISACRAILKGWQVNVNPNLKVISRQVGDNVNYGYYGYSCYYRGHTPIYAILMTLKLMARFKFNKALHFAKAYFWSLLILKPRIGDPEIIKYYRWHVLRKLKSKFI